MSFIRHKIINGHMYAYEITAFWDPEIKKNRQKTKYLGRVGEDGKIAEKKTQQEKLQLDFGNTFLLNEFCKTLKINTTLEAIFTNICPELKPLLFYRLCEQSAMYNAKDWWEGNVVSKLFKNVNLSSQHISKILKLLGSENIQRDFFVNYLNSIGPVEQGIIIDATSLPNRSKVSFNSWGYDEGTIDKQIRMLCVLDQTSKIPMFYRYLPGNILDVSTLGQTIAELNLLGVKSKYVLIDAGYFSESNVKELYEQKIDFLTRIPSSRTIYKKLLAEQTVDLESIKYATKCGTRGLFVKRVEVDLYEYKAYAYIVLDPARKAKEIQQKMVEYIDNSQECMAPNLANCGIMMLIGSKALNPETVVSDYYLRQSVEQVFGFYKDDLGLLPLRGHSDETIRGYLLLQFITLLIFIELRQKLDSKYTVEQALNITRNLKCKVFEKQLLIAEQTKKQREIYNLCGVIVPKNCGI